jgi:hypothetical protein
MGAVKMATWQNGLGCEEMVQQRLVSLASARRGDGAAERVAGEGGATVR